MANERAGQAADGRQATADYLTTMLEELSPLAQRNGLHVVAYLLDMALMEAKSVAGSPAKSGDRLR